MISHPLLRRLAAAGLALAAVAAVVGYGYLRWVLEPQLPPVDNITELKLGQPLRIYTRDGKLMAEFGAERREPLKYEEIPPTLIQAFLAAEDDRFFEHPGVDWQGLVRAALKLAATGEKAQGGSTITMQLARNVFLTSEKTFSRKLREILLALKIENAFSKQQILEIYLNKIFLGNRAYGVAAAAQVYFGKDVHALTLGQTALLAGLPKAPSRDNPAANPERAMERRDYVLRRMHDLHEIDDAQFQTALAEPVSAQLQQTQGEVDAHYVAEMVRAELFERFEDTAYSDGYIVTTTIDAAQQAAANEALRTALRDYDERHGWQGPEATLPAEALAELGAKPRDPLPLFDAALDGRPAVVGLLPAVVLDSAPGRLRVLTREHTIVELGKDAIDWAALGDKNPLVRGDIVRIRHLDRDGWKLSQVPQVQGAFVALDPHDGAIRALVGGYDFFEGKFNRAIQARRQPGSGFKPFLYSAALAAGYTPASVILDAPVVFDDTSLEDTWRPENYSGTFSGPMRLREALVESRNLVSIRLLQAIGIDYARNYAAQFGLPADRMPRDLTLALGSAAFTPLEVARGYAVLANGGFRVEPYFISSIRATDGRELFKANPAIACPACPDTLAAPESAASPPPPDAPSYAPRVLEPRIVYLTRDMMRDVVTRGTGARAHELGRNDLAGKTGTTNDETDAWFNGFNSTLVGVCWMGYDQPAPLGRGEVGGRAALPMWMDFMRVALKGVPEQWPERPAGLVSVRINPKNGLLAASGATGAIFEIVQAEHVPPPDTETSPETDKEHTKPEDLY